MARGRRIGPRIAACATAALMGFVAWLSFESVEPLAPAASKFDCVTVGVISNGFHASLAAPSETLAALGVETSATGWTEIGWGEAQAFQADSLSLDNALHAVFTPGPTAMFVARLQGPPSANGGSYRTVGLSRAGFSRLVADLGEELARDPAGRPILLSRGHGGVFYSARSGYGAAHTCNVWTAERLRRAGLPIRARSALTADGLLTAVERAPQCRRPA